MKISKLATGILLVSAAYLPGMASGACIDDHPAVTVVSEGGGQSSGVNSTLMTTFRGHIMTMNGLTNRGRNSVTVCPGTTVDYAVSSTMVNGLDPRPDCSGRSSYGVLSVGDKLSCNNKKLGGSDSDSFVVKAGR